MNNAFRTSIITQPMKYWFLQQVKKTKFYDYFSINKKKSNFDRNLVT